MAFRRQKAPKNSHPALWDKEQFSKLWFSMTKIEICAYLKVGKKAVENAVHRHGLIGLKPSRRQSNIPDGEKRVTKDGYVEIHKEGKWQLEHRWVMKQALGRPLLKSEPVHHINGNRTDNRVENLEILSPATHRLKDNYCHNCSLRKEIRLLRWQIKELRETLQLKLDMS